MFFASLFAVGLAVGANALTAMNGAQQIYVDLTDCNGRFLPAVNGTGDFAGSKISPVVTSSHSYEFTLPETFSGKLYLKNLAETNITDPQSVAFAFYEDPDADTPNSASIVNGTIVAPITAVKFFTEDNYISGDNSSATITSTNSQEALSVYYCHAYSA